MDHEGVSIPLGAEILSGLFLRPDKAEALYLFAHGAGTNMAHPTMASNAEGLARRGIATLRFNFLYTQKGGKRPDPPKLAHAAVRAAAGKAVDLAPDLPLFAGGRSFGGRMTSQAQADDPLPAVRGLAFLGFPLHPAGKPGTERADHLANVRVPMLFVSGTKDALAELDLLKPVVAGLGERARLHLVAEADHSFRVAAKSGRTNAEAEADALDAIAEWASGLE
jgi:predicted alpha/beta-hydrolase family hydrolase